MDRHYYKYRLHARISKGLENLQQNLRKENNAQEIPYTTKSTSKTTERQWKIPQCKQKQFTKAILKKSDELKNKNNHSDHQNLENNITTPEVTSAINSLKLGQTARLDGIHKDPF